MAKQRKTRTNPQWEFHETFGTRAEAKKYLKMQNYSSDHTQGGSTVFRCTAHDGCNRSNGMKMLLTPRIVLEVSELIVPATDSPAFCVLQMVLNLMRNV